MGWFDTDDAGRAGMLHQQMIDRAREADPEYQKQQEYARLIDQSKTARDADLAEGQARGEQLFGGTSYGRSRGERSQDVQNILDMRKALLYGGMPQEQMNAFRSQASDQINGQLQTGLRAVRGNAAMSGLRGGAAAAQQMRLVQQANQQRAQSERDLFLKQMAQRRQDLNSLEGSVNTAEKNEIDRSNSNLYGKLATELGYGSLGAGERGAINQQIIGQQQAAAAQAAANRGGKK